MQSMQLRRAFNAQYQTRIRVGVPSLLAIPRTRALRSRAALLVRVAVNGNVQHSGQPQHDQVL